MLRSLATLLLPAALLLTSGPASAHWPRPIPAPIRAPWMNSDLPGTYTNASAGGQCFVYAERAGYLFINEKGSRAWFVYSAPNQLRMASGQWDPNIVVTTSKDAYGRNVLRFDAPYTPTGYWVSSY